MQSQCSILGILLKVFFFFFLIISWFSLPEDFLPEVFCHVLILNVPGGEPRLAHVFSFQDKVISLSYLDAQRIFFIIWSPLASCYALEKEMATHSSVLAWRLPGMGEPGGLPSMGSHRAGHDWRDLAATASCWLLLSSFSPWYPMCTFSLLGIFCF